MCVETHTAGEQPLVRVEYLVILAEEAAHALTALSAAPPRPAMGDAAGLHWPSPMQAPWPRGAWPGNPGSENKKWVAMSAPAQAVQPSDVGAPRPATATDCSLMPLGLLPLLLLQLLGSLLLRELAGGVMLQAGGQPLLLLLLQGRRRGVVRMMLLLLQLALLREPLLRDVVQLLLHVCAGRRQLRRRQQQGGGYGRGNGRGYAGARYGSYGAAPHEVLHAQPHRLLELRERLTGHHNGHAVLAEYLRSAHVAEGFFFTFSCHLSGSAHVAQGFETPVPLRQEFTVESEGRACAL